MGGLPGGYQYLYVSCLPRRPQSIMQAETHQNPNVVCHYWINSSIWMSTQNNITQLAVLFPGLYLSVPLIQQNLSKHYLKSFTFDICDSLLVFRNVLAYLGNDSPQFSIIWTIIGCTCLCDQNCLFLLKCLSIPCRIFHFVVKICLCHGCKSWVCLLLKHFELEGNKVTTICERGGFCSNKHCLVFWQG